MRSETSDTKFIFYNTLAEYSFPNHVFPFGSYASVLMMIFDSDPRLLERWHSLLY